MAKWGQESLIVSTGPISGTHFKLFKINLCRVQKAWHLNLWNFTLDGSIYFIILLTDIVDHYPVFYIANSMASKKINTSVSKKVYSYKK